MANGSFEEDERAAATYFHARTRLGDDSRRVLVTRDSSDGAVLSQSRQPPKGVLRDLFLQMANIPAWWLQGVTPQPGYDAIVDGPDWTRGLSILPMIDKRWRGLDKKLNPFVMRDDVILGLTLEKEGQT